MGIHALAISEMWLLLPLTLLTTVLVGETQIAQLLSMDHYCIYKRTVLWVFEVHIPNAVVMHLIDYDMWILAVYQPPSYTIMINPCC